MSGTIEAAQRDLSVCHEKLGNVLQASGDLAGARETYQNGMVIDLKLAREEGNAQAQRDLAASYNRLGNVLQASGDLVGAREAYENDLTIALNLARDEGNAEAQRDLALSYSAVGMIRRRSRMRPVRATPSRRASRSSDL